MNRLLFILLFLGISTVSHAKFGPDYKEATLYTEIIKVGEGDDVRYVPMLPMDKDLKMIRTGLTLVFCEGVNYYAYPLPKELEGKFCIAHIVYFAEDEEIVKNFPIVTLGKGNEVCKTFLYQSVVKTTVADVKIAEEKARLTAEAEAIGEVVKPDVLDKVTYTKPDFADGHPVWIFLDKSYADK